MALKHIFQPLALGPITVPNRIARTGHGTGLGGGTISQALIDYHLARAKGGVGLTILEAAAVYRTAYPFLVAGAPGIVEGYRRLMAGVRSHGMKVFQQLGHLGHEISQADGSPPLSASDTVGARLGVQAQAMTRRQIGELIDSYAAAAADCAAGGLDGVELHMAHGYLVQQFMSPLHNFRTDGYGGSLENRLRLPIAILAAVRGAVGPGMAVGVRLSPELISGGMEAEDIAQVANVFADAGLIDFIDVSIGTNHNLHKIIGAMHEPAGYQLGHDDPIRARVRVPMLVTGRFRTLEEAEQVIGAGAADLVGMTRAHIADPDIVRKTLDGRGEEVRPCIGCNHGCFAGLRAVGRIGCTVNVAAGNEALLSEDLIRSAPESRRVLVVGGGPAGLEAARVAALRGHCAILAEAASSLGGAVNVARRAPRRGGIGDIIDWLEREVFRLGVEVRLGTYITASDVAAIAPDATIVATGSRPRMDGRQHLSPGQEVPGIDLPHVVSSHDLLMHRGQHRWGSRALVYDDAGHYEGIAVAEHLIELGVAVTFVTGLGAFAPLMESSLTAEPALERLARGNFELVTHGRLLAIEPGRVRVQHRYGGKTREIAADTVVFVSHNACNRNLLDELEDWRGPVIPVGDVRSPRYLQTAIREGHLAARAIA